MNRVARLLLAVVVVAAGLVLAPSDASAAEPCGQGTYSPDGTTDTGCMPCPAGTFQDQLGQTSCELAQPGYYTPGEAFAFSIACEVDTFTAVEGSSGCTPCPPGTSTNGMTGQSECQNDPGPAMPTEKSECKKGGWQAFGVFKNQGACVSYVANGSSAVSEI